MKIFLRIILVASFFGFPLITASCAKDNNTTSRPAISKADEDIVRDLMNSEKSAGERMGFLTPIMPWDGWASYWAEQITNGKNSKYKNIGEYFDEYKHHSSSAFLLRHNEKKIILTAGHVADYFRQNGIVIHVKNSWVKIDKKFVSSSTLDLAAVDVTGVAELADVGAGTLQMKIDDLLPNKSKLYVHCNPLVFSSAVIVGVFSEFRVIASHKHLAASFAGTGVKDGCSGSPLTDDEKLVRGLVVRSANSGSPGYAVPAGTIAIFLDEKFFK